jgi:glycosyltransferase involved in cell wall biosynthesis
MPFRIGSGTRLKLLQALAAGKAVVSTSRGAEGYPVVNEKHLLLADDPRHFAEAVLRLLDDTAQRSRLGTAGQAFARGYDWRNVIPTFEQLYARIGLL